MKSPLETAQKSWFENLPQQRLDGNKYAIGIQVDKLGETCSMTLEIYTWINQHWQPISFIEEINYELSEAEFHVLKSKAETIDQFAIDLVELEMEAHVRNTEYNEGKIAKSRDPLYRSSLATVLDYFAEPKNSPFDGEQLPIEAQDAYADVAGLNIIESVEQYSARIEAIHRRIVREKTAALIKQGQTQLNIAGTDQQEYARELDPQYVTLTEELLSNPTQEEIDQAVQLAKDKVKERLLQKALQSPTGVPTCS